MILGVGEATVRRWARAGKIPCRIIEHKSRRSYIFAEGELQHLTSGAVTLPTWEPTLNFGALDAENTQKH